MLSEQFFPSAVTEFDKPRRSLNNVREQYGGEHAVSLGFNFAALAREKGLNLSDDCVCVPDPRVVICSREFHILRPVNLPGEVSSMLDVDGVACAMQDQGGNPDCRKHVSNIDTVIH